MRFSGFTNALATMTAVAVPLAAQQSPATSATMLRAQAFSSVLEWPADSPALRHFLSALRSASDPAGPRIATRGVRDIESPLVSRGWDAPLARFVQEGGALSAAPVPDLNPDDVITTTPEPATMALLGGGLVLMAAATIRSRRVKKG